MITMTEFIEKIDAITGQQMDDTKANQLCRLYAMIYDRGKNSGYNICVAKACDWLRAELDKEEERHYIHVHGFDKERREIFLEGFFKAMKGEQI